MSKHTPGPWQVSGSEIIGANGEFICEMAHCSDKEQAAMLAADALVMATGLELLDALKEIRRIAADIPAVERNPRFMEANRAALAAIAKAEGK